MRALGVDDKGLIKTVLSLIIKSQYKMILICFLLLVALSSTYDFKCDVNHQSWRRHPRLYLNEREVLAPTAHSFFLIVDITDQVVSKSILETGTWEPQILILISKLVQKNNTVLNLGSQSGLEAVVMGKIIGPQGKLYIFQPYSVSYKIVVKNMEINSLADISHVYKMGVGKERQTLQLWIDQYNTGHSTFVKNKETSSQFQEIEIDTVDNLLPNISVDFALIDVQMFEVEALLGMKQVLKRSPSLIAIIEWRYLSNQHRKQSQTQQLLKWLFQEGFQWYRYKEASNVCEVGSIEVLQPNQLLLIKQEDLLLIGKQVDLQQILKSN